MKEALLEIARLIHLANDRFPSSYNHVMVAGWTQYTERAIERSARGDLDLQMMILKFYLKIIAEITSPESKANPELFSRRDMDWLDKDAETLEVEIAVRRGIMPRLEDLSLEDMVKKVSSG